MSRSKTSNRWLQEHFSDPYVKRAQQEGYRSRAAYKLLEIQEKLRLFKPGMTVVDLGAAPGGWAQVAKQLVGDKGRVIALDILPMDALAGVEFIQGDFTSEAVLETLLQLIDHAPIDLVISDMAPNMSGLDAVDQPKSMYLAELALELAQKVLHPKGGFLVKTFQGEGFDSFLKSLRQQFQTVRVLKPKASRARSSEVYLFGQGFKGII